MGKYWTPASLVWLLAHAIVGLVGYMVLKVPDINKIFGETASIGIGASLIAAGATGVALFLYVVFNDSLRARLEILSRSGISAIFEGRSTRMREEYDERISRGQSIDIIGFGLSQFREDYLNQFSSWSRHKKIRILLLDPNFPTENTAYVVQRDREELNPENKIGSDIKIFVESVKSITGLNRQNFQVRYMRALPAINVFRIDDELFWGPYLMDTQSRNTLTLIAKKGGFVYDQVLNHFENIWNNTEHSVDAL